MTEMEFSDGINRLISDFGAQSFKKERMLMIWKMVCDLSSQDFNRICSQFLSTMRQAPLPKDFQDAAYGVRKSTFNREVDGAVKTMDREWQGGLKSYLAKAYGSECKTLNGAVQIQIERDRIEKALRGESK